MSSEAFLRLGSDLARGSWDRAGACLFVLLHLEVVPREAGCCLAADGWRVEARIHVAVRGCDGRASPSDVAMMRMLSRLPRLPSLLLPHLDERGAAANVAMVEVPLERAAEAAERFDALVALVPSPAMRLRRTAARVSVRVRLAGALCGPDGRCVGEDAFELTVRPGQVAVPLWRGVTLVPTVGSWVCPVAIDAYGPHELRPLLLCAMFAHRPSRHELAWRRCLFPCPLAEDRGAEDRGAEEATDATPLLRLPDLRAALDDDAGAERRARARASACARELAEAAWHPRRVARGLRLAGGNLESLDAL